jgi:hypothetical protein
MIMLIMLISMPKGIPGGKESLYTAPFQIGSNVSMPVLIREGHELHSTSNLLMPVTDQQTMRFDSAPMRPRTIGMNGFPNSRLEKGENAPIKTGTRWHARFPKKLPEYAKAYCRGVDTIKAWIHRGKRSGWLPPLEHPGDLVSWYEQHIGACPDDLLALCGVSSAPAAQSSNGNGEQPLDLQQAVVEVRKLLATEIATLNRANISDGRRNILLRNVQKTADSLCRLETASAGIRRDKRDALPWGVFAAGVEDIMGNMTEIRRGWPRRLFIEMEKILCRHHYRVLRALKEPLEAAAKKVCEDDLKVIAQSEAFRPVIEKMAERYRELEASALQAYRDGKTPIPMTFERIEGTMNETT